MTKRATQSKHDRRQTQSKRVTKQRDEKIETAFPAPAQTPGQAESRDGFERFQQRKSECPWWNDYLLLREEGFTWRIATYIAWSASPAKDRWPATQQELADQILGLKSDRVIRRWRMMNPAIDVRIERFQVEPLLRHRRDVIDALIEVASSRDAAATTAKKLFFEMTGDYKPSSGLSINGENGSAVEVKFNVNGLPTDLLRSLADEGTEEPATAGSQVGTGAA